MLLICAQSKRLVVRHFQGTYSTFLLDHKGVAILRKFNLKNYRNILENFEIFTILKHHKFGYISSQDIYIFQTPNI